ncbi:unnamed protein product [Sphagnum balticum]
MTSTDADLPENANNTYRLLTNDTTMPFSIDAVSGNVSTTRALDREQQSDMSCVWPLWTARGGLRRV